MREDKKVGLTQKLELLDKFGEIMARLCDLKLRKHNILKGNMDEYLSPPKLYDFQILCSAESITS